VDTVPWQDALMRWERLFDDVEAQLEAAEQAELAGEVADRTRREIARLRLVDRLRASVGAELQVRVAGAGALSGRLRRAGEGWLLLSLESGPPAFVVSAAVLTVDGLPAAARDPGSEGPVLSRLDLAHALRAVARDRSAVTVVLRDGTRLDGTLDRVGADFADLALHPVGEARRPSAVRSVRAVTFEALAVIRPD
jgi:hypothetical protein